MVNTVVTQMRNLDINEIELMALCGLFIWKDSKIQLNFWSLKYLAAVVLPETMTLILDTRDHILIDLHTFYRSKGLIEAQITLRVAKLMLLIPKSEVLIYIFCSHILIFPTP